MRKGTEFLCLNTRVGRTFDTHLASRRCGADAVFIIVDIVAIVVDITVAIDDRRIVIIVARRAQPPKIYTILSLLYRTATGGLYHLKSLYPVTVPLLITFDPCPKKIHNLIHFLSNLLILLGKYRSLIH